MQSQLIGFIQSFPLLMEGASVPLCPSNISNLHVVIKMFYVCDICMYVQHVDSLQIHWRERWNHLQT